MFKMVNKGTETSLRAPIIDPLMVRENVLERLALDRIKEAGQCH